MTQPAARHAKAHIAHHYLEACISGAIAQGVDKAALLTAAGIPADGVSNPHYLLTEQQLSRLIKAVWRTTCDEFMGLAPMVCKNGVFALMAELAQQASTLGGMLEQSARFYRTVYHYLDAELEDERQTDSQQRQVFYRLHLQDQGRDPAHLLQEFLLLMWQRFGSWLVGQHVPFNATYFSYAAPSHAREYDAMFTGNLVFNAPTCGFSLHPRYLQLPIIRTRDELDEFLKASPAMILHRPDQDDRLTTRVRMLLQQYDFHQLPELDELSEHLHLAPRTLRRKLADEGSSLRAIKEALRKEFAMKLLGSEHLSINDISERAGFSETAAFCRAFKRWTGVSPSQWRHARSHS